MTHTTVLSIWSRLLAAHISVTNLAVFVTGKNEEDRDWSAITPRHASERAGMTPYVDERSVGSSVRSWTWLANAWVQVLQENTMRKDGLLLVRFDESTGESLGSGKLDCDMEHNAVLHDATVVLSFSGLVFFGFDLTKLAPRNKERTLVWVGRATKAKPVGSGRSPGLAPPHLFLLSGPRRTTEPTLVSPNCTILKPQTQAVVQAGMPWFFALLWTAHVALGTPYDDAQTNLFHEREAFAAQPRTPALRGHVRVHLLERIRGDLMPPWLGTPWDFYGTTQTPGEGQIACGYFVSTLLEDAGLRVERVTLAQQASEYIVRTFSEPNHILRIRTGDVDGVVRAVLSQPEGLYIVGLDYHVGFLVRRGAEVEFCHSSYLDTGGVVCEDPRTSGAFVSSYHVVGPVLEDAVIDAWLDQTLTATVTR